MTLPSVSPTPGSHGGGCPILVARESQLAALEDVLLEARRGQGRLVVLAGEAGIGKTRLAGELMRQAERLGSAVLVGGCSEAELSLPYLPFVQAIGNYLASRGATEVAARVGPMAAELAQLFPQFGAPPPPPAAAESGQVKLRLFEAIVSLLAVPAEERSLLLVIEDAHWADDSSRELLDYVARRLSGLRALVLVTYRSDELHRRHPFLPTLREWRRSGVAEVIELSPLPRDGAARMIAAITGEEIVDPDLLDVLYERTDGNPFFLEEMLSEVRPADPEGRFTDGRAAGFGIPETVRDTILHRVSRLERQFGQVLEAAAVLGRVFDYGTLLAVARGEDAVVQEALGDAIAEQLVEEEPGEPGRYRWRHALTQEAIYESIVSPRAQAIHSRAADVLAEAGARPIDVANHLLAARRFEEAVPICLASADEAERATAFGEAALALERIVPHVADRRERAAVICRIGHDLALNGEPGQAQGFLAEGVENLEALGEQRRAARYRIILGRCYWEREQPDAARVEYERARDVLAAEGPSAELAMAYVRLAGLAAFALDYRGCAEAAGAAVEIAQAAGADFERVYALGFVGLSHLDRGEEEIGLETMDACYEEARANGYWHVAQNVTWNDIWTRIHILRGGLEERLERFSEMPSWPLMTLTETSARSYVRKAQGDLHGAREDAEVGIGLNERLGYRKMVWRSRVHLADILAELGRYDEANAVLPPAATRTELQDIVYDSSARIRTLLGSGAIDEAAELARESVSHAASFAAYREPLALAVEAFVAAGDLAAARAALDAGRASPSASGAAFLDEAEGRLALAEGRAGDALAPLRRALAAAEREGYPLMSLRDTVLLARALAAGGERDAAEEALREVLGRAAALDAGLIADEARAAAAEAGIALPEPPPPAPRESQRSDAAPAGERLITSLFADVRGYTEMTAERPPVETAERIATLYRFARVAVERHGGLVDKFAGDAVMATFNIAGTEVSHVVDAVQAALTLRDKAALMDLPVGIGIATGAAILGPGASGDNVAISGVATNLAARLQTAASAGEILLSAESYRRAQAWLGERGLDAERDELRLKGFAEPQAAYRLPAPAAVGAPSPP